MCSALENLEKEAMKKGIQQGIEKGIEKGEIKFAISLYQDGTLDKETCAKKLNITAAEFDRLLKENEI